MPIGRARLRIHDYNEKRKASLKKKERGIQMVSLSLTSMVDMFAILVLYLLVNSEMSQWLEMAHVIELPKAAAVEAPVKALTLEISRDQLFGDKSTALGTIADIRKSKLFYEPLRSFLKSQKDQSLPVTILADARVPFAAMRRIVATCQDAGFGSVNLAVSPKAQPKG